MLIYSFLILNISNILNFVFTNPFWVFIKKIVDDVLKSIDGLANISIE